MIAMSTMGKHGTKPKAIDPHRSEIAPATQGPSAVPAREVTVKYSATPSILCSDGTILKPAAAAAPTQAPEARHTTAWFSFASVTLCTIIERVVYKIGADCSAHASVSAFAARRANHAPR